MIYLDAYGFNTSRILTGEKKQVLQPIGRGDYINWDTAYTQGHILDVYSESGEERYKVGKIYPTYVAGTNLPLWYYHAGTVLYVAHMYPPHGVNRAWRDGDTATLEAQGFKPFTVKLVAIKRAICNYWLLRWE